jgi:S-adenosyl methyltransferase
VRFLAAEAGIQQFIDIGTGIPSAGNVHEVAGQAAPDTRVVYVDNDPIVLSHARALLTSTAGPTDYLEADARDTKTILARASETLDFSQPVGIMLLAILHCIPDEDDPRRIVTELLDAVPSGSFLALTHPARDQVSVAVKAEQSLTRSMRQQVTFRTRDEVAALVTGLDVVEPGVVPIQEWHPESVLDFNSAPTAMWGVVARKQSLTTVG